VLIPGPPRLDAADSVECRRWLAPAGAMAAICLGLALQISNGVLEPTALARVVLSFALILVAVLTPRPATWVRLDAWLVSLIGAAGLALNLRQLATTPPALYLRAQEQGLGPFHVGLTIMALASAAALFSARRTTPLLIGLLVAAHAALGTWIIHQSAGPAIDVHVFHKYAIAALRQGVDPYAITFPDIYRNGAYYGPGTSVSGQLQFGFPYFPLSLLLSMPGQILFNDPRYAQLAAMGLAAVLMTFARPSGLGLIAAALYLTTPRIFFVLEQSWTEPFLVLGVAAVTYASCRRSRLLPWLFGAFIALKQYLVFALPTLLFLVEAPRDRRRVWAFLARAAAVGAAVTLPFVLWNPAAFWKSVVALQFHQPFRPDALSLLAWWAGGGHDRPGSAISFAVAAAGSALALWRLPRTPAGFAMAIALTFMGFFVFSKQAFCNYYFFVIGALCASLAAWRPPHRPSDA
jgi:hypothetical protein